MPGHREIGGWRRSASGCCCRSGIPVLGGTRPPGNPGVRSRPIPSRWGPMTAPRSVPEDPTTACGSAEGAPNPRPTARGRGPSRSKADSRKRPLEVAHCAGEVSRTVLNSVRPPFTPGHHRLGGPQPLVGQPIEVRHRLSRTPNRAAAPRHLVGRAATAIDRLRLVLLEDKADGQLPIVSGLRLRDTRALPKVPSHLPTLPMADHSPFGELSAHTIG